VGASRGSGWEWIASFELDFRTIRIGIGVVVVMMMMITACELKWKVQGKVEEISWVEGTRCKDGE
jgi:hypothetical protein